MIDVHGPRFFSSLSTCSTLLFLSLLLTSSVCLLSMQVLFFTSLERYVCDCGFLYASFSGVKIFTKSPPIIGIDFKKFLSFKGSCSRPAENQAIKRRKGG